MLFGLRDGTLVAHVSVGQMFCTTCIVLLLYPLVLLEAINLSHKSGINQQVGVNLVAGVLLKRDQSSLGCLDGATANGSLACHGGLAACRCLAEAKVAI